MKEITSFTEHWSTDGDCSAHLHRPASFLSQTGTAAGPHALHFPWKTVSPTACSSLATSLDAARAVPTIQLPGFQQLCDF